MSYPFNADVQQTAQHIGENTGRGVSPHLWKYLAKASRPASGSVPSTTLYDDFTNFYPVTLTTAAGQLAPGNGYFAYIELDNTAGSILPLATESGGVIRLLTSTDSGDGLDHQTVLGTGGNVGTLGMISDTAADAKLTIFEARVRLGSVTDGIGSMFVGLGEEGLCTGTTPLVTDTTHKLSDDDLIGFAVLEGDCDSLTFQYRKNGAAVQTPITYATALEADTWYNLGFVYDPSGPTTKRIRVFIDDVEQSTYITGANIAAATFPDGEELAMYASVIASANNAPHDMDIDWWAFYQEG